MSDLRELYQEVILDHSRSPRNFGRPAGANRDANGHNTLCGDRLTVYLHVEEGTVVDVGFDGSGCAISTASASLMTEAVKGKSAEEAERMFEDFHTMLTGDPSEEAEVPAGLGKLEVMSGVRKYPVRVKCATLAWHTMHAALEEAEEPVSTE